MNEYWNKDNYSQMLCSYNKEIGDKTIEEKMIFFSIIIKKLLDEFLVPRLFEQALQDLIKVLNYWMGAEVVLRTLFTMIFYSLLSSPF